MNILMFVLFFSVLLALSFNTLFLNILSGQKIKTSYTAYFQTKRKLQDIYVKKTFDQIKQPSKINTATKKTAKNSSKRRSFKTELFPDCSKLNLWLLIQENQKDPFYYELFAKLLRTLYKNNLFATLPEKIEYKIIDAILLASKKTDNNQSLSEMTLPKLFLQDSKLQLLYYKILKGTKNYRTDQKRGYPSLLDFIKIQPTQNEICIRCASKELLKLLFDQKIADLLWSEKQEELERLSISKAKLQEIFQQLHVQANEKIWSILKFNHPKNSSKQVTITAEDLKNTNLKLKRKVSCENL